MVPGIRFWRQFGAVDQADADRLVGAALDAGINFVDTANVYGDGESEEMLGRALSKRRQDVVVATKVHAPTGAGRNDLGLSRLHIMRALEDSLRRLGTEYVDLYHLHNFDPATPMEDPPRAGRCGPPGQGPLHRRRAAVSYILDTHARR